MPRIERRVMSAIVEVHDLVKRFGDVAAVDGVAFSIEEGSVFGLLGPNGAGKTTTISMIACLLKPDAGSITVAGADAATDSLAVRSSIGVVPQEIALYPTLTAGENLRFWGRMYGLSGHALSEAVTYGLEMAGLEDQVRKRVETFSGGMKRRLNIAAGVLHRPKVLLMDEPTVGIDPQSRNHILDTVRELNLAGTTVLYTSHYMEEVQALCDRIAIMDHGRVIASGDLDDLRALVGDEDRIAMTVSEGAGEAALAVVQGVAGVSTAEVTEDALSILTPDGAAALGPVVEALSAAGVAVRSVDVTEPDLEAVFLHLTGRGLRD